MNFNGSKFTSLEFSASVLPNYSNWSLLMAIFRQYLSTLNDNSSGVERDEWWKSWWAVCLTEWWAGLPDDCFRIDLQDFNLQGNKSVDLSGERWVLLSAGHKWANQIKCKRFWRYCWVGSLVGAICSVLRSNQTLCSSQSWKMHTRAVKSTIKSAVDCSFGRICNCCWDVTWLRLFFAFESFDF